MRLVIESIRIFICGMLNLFILFLLLLRERGIYLYRDVRFAARYINTSSYIYIYVYVSYCCDIQINSTRLPLEAIFWFDKFECGLF